MNTVNSLLILPSMQLISDRCLSKIIVNVRKISSSLAVCFEIYLSFPKTDEMVSSTNDSIDFFSMLLQEDTLAVFSIFIPAVPFTGFLERIEFFENRSNYILLLWALKLIALVILLGVGYCKNLGVWLNDSSTDFFRFFLKF
jgi:hypothetical protein